MLIKYDFHIHTVLSPCGYRDMTPNNIVNMAALNQLDAIAITDHNTCGNVKAVMDVAKNKNIIVIPGIEIETKEEIHVLCFFSCLNDVYNMQNIVNKSLPKIKNQSNIFGEQHILDENDDIVGIEEQMLLTATKLSINDLLKYTIELNGVLIPAHIDRPSFSIISNLGLIPEELELTTLEVSRQVKEEQYQKIYNKYKIIQSSDAHELGYIGICENTLNVDDSSIKGILNVLSKKI